MDLFLIIVAGILIVIGFLGSILPVLPGPPLSYVGLLVLHFTDKVQFSTNFLIYWAIIVILIQVLDAFIPIWGTKKFGGSKQGMWGSTIGILVGMFFGPVGIVFGPFIGAFIGELSANKNNTEALKAAFGAFIGFVVGTVSKLIIAGFMIYYYVEALI
ncbi:MAG: DUF456 domain-containing protein [Paludibacter sp.]|nr:DUF456 domain-containing protein [Paludibacter sp.]